MMRNKSKRKEEEKKVKMTNSQGGRRKGLYIGQILVLVAISGTFLVYRGTSKVQMLPCGDACAERRDTIPAAAYVLNTPGCAIPGFSPDHSSIAKYKVKERIQFSCSKKRPLTEADSISLYLYEDRAADYGIPGHELVCVYQGIVRVEESPEEFTVQCDRQFRLNSKILITKNRTSIEEDGILVSCYFKEKEIYKNVHYFLQPRRSKEKREKFQEEHAGQRHHMLSVLIMGTDSVSRANMRRNMPRTFDFLQRHPDVLDFRAFNKVADNTNPNTVASLIGLTQKEVHETCQSEKTNYDDCPLIWKNFSRAGYVTLYGEDCPLFGAFHYHRFGFVREPTDYYNRPAMLAADRFTKHKAGQKHVMGLCLGGDTAISVIHKYSLMAADSLRDTPYFGFFWNSGMTHQRVEWASAADEPSLQYLKALQESGVMDHTIVFFISDHGIRFGDIRLTYAGFLEERLPYFFALFPPWFKERFPGAWQNLVTNTDRLVSNFDFHVTLRDILAGAFASPSRDLPPLRHGQSLFEEIPVNRTCADATIPEHYCTCEHQSEVSVDDKILLDAATYTVSQLNEQLARFEECAQLYVQKIIRGQVGSRRKGAESKEKHPISVITVLFETLPGEGKLEATLTHHKNEFELTAEISRVNMYGNQSHCISDPFYQRYCYCNDLLPASPTALE
ncbi:uncharacterized protein LOC125040694 isoform X2 [Penaeus chinensis]|uniref:uncharacterized protein LOC125040694 isoform X2 n=1 Tax=Penaeus chinensis TaxID=139456 RepID=UPI001FB808C4|nr:uncharacterized protein LOC125040694 isoform X2 [Penaeus chinensis]XP_047491340.1 uncharacterized protein LOC125040694 isoform X2 [Penaeus chinensis]